MRSMVYEKRQEYKTQKQEGRCGAGDHLFSGGACAAGDHRTAAVRQGAAAVFSGGNGAENCRHFHYYYTVFHIKPTEKEMFIGSFASFYSDKPEFICFLLLPLL